LNVKDLLCGKFGGFLGTQTLTLNADAKVLIDALKQFWELCSFGRLILGLSNLVKSAIYDY
jgi:hypothetical protein